MKFEEILKTLKQGKKAKLRYWDSETFICLDIERNWLVDETHKIYALTPKDLMSDEWETIGINITDIEKKDLCVLLKNCRIRRMPIEICKSKSGRLGWYIYFIRNFKSDYIIETGHSMDIIPSLDFDTWYSIDKSDIQIINQKKESK